jgi:hypothetical protein
MTGTGTSGTINGEANLTFTGSLLAVTGRQNIVDTASAVSPSLYVDTNSASADPSSSIYVRNRGNSTTTVERVGIDGVVNRGTTTNIGVRFDVTGTGGTANTGVWIINSSITSASTQRGYYALIDGNISVPSKPIKIGTDVSISGTGDSGYGFQAQVTGQNNENIGFRGIISGSLGTNYVVWGSNSSVTSAAGDTQYGSYMQVNGSGSTSDTTKIGYGANVDGDGAVHYGFKAFVRNSTAIAYGVDLLVDSGFGSNYGIYVSNTSNVTGGSDIQYGVYSDVTGDGDGGSTIKYAGYFLTTGASETNFGIFVSATGAAADNVALYVVSGRSVFNASNSTTSDVQILGNTNNNLFLADVSADKIGILDGSPDRALSVGGDYKFVHNPTSTLTSSVSGYGDIVTFGTGTLTAGSLYYLNSSQVWTGADASAESTASGMLAIALGTAPSNGMLVRGYARNSAWTQNTGDILYLSETTGAITSTAPSTAASIIRIVGYMINGAGDQIYFNPSNDWTEN